MKPNYYSQSTAVGATSVLRQAFAWMFAGLAVTGVAALAAASSVAFEQMLIATPMLLMGLFIVEIGLVWFVSARISTLSHPVAIALFLAYALLNGITLSFLLLIYTSESVAASFFAASAMFGVMAGYGYVTNKDLSSVGRIAFMGLIGLIIAMVINFFLHSDAMSYVISLIGIIIFTALTAYDTQRIKAMSQTMGGENLGIYGALRLYLDFINLFIFILRLMGRRR